MKAFSFEGLRFCKAAKYCALLFMVLGESAFGAAQVTGVSVASGLTINPGQSFPVTIVLARVGSTPANMQVTYTLLNPSGVAFANLGTEPFTTPGNYTVNVHSSGPFYGPATGWRVQAKEVTQTQAAASSNTFSVSQNPPKLEFIGVITTNGDRLIIGNTPHPTADTSITTAQTAYFQVLIKNNGEATESGCELRILLDGQLAFDDTPLPSMQGTQFVSISPSVGMPNLPAGSHTLTFQILGGNDSVHNTLSEVFTVTSLVDLAPSKPAGWSSALVVSKTSGDTTGGTTFLSTDSLFANFGFANTGTGAAGPFHVRLLLDGTQVGGTQTSAGLAAGASGAVTNLALGTLSTGSHQIQAVVDSSGEVAETNETNNTITQTIMVTAPPVSVPFWAVALLPLLLVATVSPLLMKKSGGNE